MAADGGGGVAIRAADADHHSAAFDEQGVRAIAADDLVHAVGDALALGAHAQSEFVVLPEVLQRRGRGDEGVVVAAEGAVVLARLPLIQLTAQQHHGEWQTEARQRLGQGDDVRLDAHFLEAEEAAGTAATGLDVVDDQQHPVLAAEFFQLAYPLGRSRVQAAFALDDFDDDRGRLVDAAGRVGEQLVHHRDGVDLIAEVVGVGHAADIAQRHAGSAAMMLIAGRRQRADAAAVEAVGEADDVVASGHLARQFQRGLDRVGAGRAGELHDVVHAARLEDQPVEGFQETLLGIGVHVQAMGETVVGNVVEQRLFEHRVVVAVVERAGTGQEIDVGLAVAGDQLGAARLLEDHGEGAAIAAHAGFVQFEGFHAVSSDSFSGFVASNGPAR